ncbi:MAG: M28 family peptidase [Clostridia bacterium]|nr:M28 family peptidase [Clostridia bacterium]
MDAWEYLEGLMRFPHRGSASGEEAAAARWIADRARALGYRVTVEPFAGSADTLHAGTSRLGLLLAASGWLALAPGRAPALVALLLALAALAPLLGEELGLPRLNMSLVLRARRSQNVVAFRPASGAAGAAGPLRLVVSAHYDTQKGSWLFHPRFRPRLPLWFGLAYAAMAAIVAADAGRLAAPGARWPVELARWAPAAFLVLLLPFLQGWLAGRYVPGANDNGSGSALALALAERLARRPPEGCELWFVWTGCEETGERGMRAFLARHRAELPPGRTRVVNLDNLGGGRFRYLAGEGMLRYVRFDRALVELAGRLATEDGFRPLPQRNLILPTDALPAALGGWPAITFIGVDDGPDGIPHYHWHDDDLAGVDRALLLREEAWLDLYLRRLAGEPD